jgi:hypothetical protein
VSQHYTFCLLHRFDTVKNQAGEAGMYDQQRVKHVYTIASAKQRSHTKMETPIF